MAAFQTVKPSQMTADEFVACFGGIFEHSVWIAEQAWQQGVTSDHDDIEALHGLMAAVVRAAPEARLRRLVEGHPQLALPVPDGDAHASSRSEQARAGLASLDPQQRERFAQLNRAYIDKFGFPFILAVEGLASEQILARFEERCAAGTPGSEWAEALEQVLAIGLLRLRRL